MNIVAGKIIVKGRGNGIPDLLVVLIDVDSTMRGQINQLTDANLVAAVDDPGFMEAVEGFWDAGFLGDRIGSVLTDAGGRFELKYEDEAFRIRNAEKRPDLALLVMAPDECLGNTNLGLPPFNRVLHFTLFFRPNAGRVESYIIALEPEMLDRFGIRYSDDLQRPERHWKELEETLAYHETLKKQRRELIKPIIEGLRQETLEAQRVRDISWQWFAAPGLWIGDSLFLGPGSSKQQVAEIQETAIKMGLDSLSNYKGNFGIWLNLADLMDFDIDPSALEGGATLDVDVDFCDFLARKGLGTDLVRMRELLDARQAAAAANHLSDPQAIESPTMPGRPDSPNSDDAPVALKEARQRIRKRVMGQIEEMPEFGEEMGARPFEDLEKLKLAINSLELSGGPANVTAFHDFYSLQVAFKDVWTASFDERLRDQAAQLYETTQQLHKEYGLEIPDLDRIQDINDTLAAFRALGVSLDFAHVEPIDRYVHDVYPQLDVTTWNRLDFDGRERLKTAANQHLVWQLRQVDDFERPLAPPEYASRDSLDDLYEKVIRNSQTSSLAKATRLTLEMSERLNEPYAFHYFAPGTINFGILLNYRQEWRPDTYQVGRLVGTVPLAPAEKRVFRVKNVVKKTRAQKEIEKSLLERSVEGQTIGRAETEVMNKTATATNFKMTAQGTFSLGVAELTMTNEFGMNQAQESSQTKRAFNEATKKSAEKVRQEREVQIELSESKEFTSEATHELSNPNNELTVTYLLYELERRYFISCRLHRLTPVVLVAMDIPAPHEITETWVLEHAWILRRALLDDGVSDAIDYIEEGSAADAIDIELKRANWDTQSRLVTKLESSLESAISLREGRRDELAKLIEEKGEAEAEQSDVEDVARAILSGGLSLLSFHDEPDRAALLDARRTGVEKALEHIRSRIEEIQGKLSRAQGALQQATADYSSALKEKARKDTLVNQALLHFRQNILHYMHAIWDSTNSDQLFFELYHRKVKVPEPSKKLRLRLATESERQDGIPGLHRDGEYYVLENPADLLDPEKALVPKPLIEVADLDRPLGYKGNYILFPLKGCTWITNVMMQEYIDDYFGVRDPDTRDSYTAEELLKYATEIWNDPEVALDSDEKQALKRLVLQKLTSPRANRDTVVVPTGQLYMEALKGEQTLLEDFKLAHRGMDVLKVQEEVREARLENLRRVARLVEGERGDPEIEKHVVIDSNEDVLVGTD